MYKTSEVERNKMKIPQDAIAYVRCPKCNRYIKLKWRPIHTEYMEPGMNNMSVEMIPGDNAVYENCCIVCKDCSS
jgi:hypothetical protein